MFRGRTFLYVGTLALLLSACGSTPPPPPPPPAGAPGPGGPAGLGSFVEEPCPGTPIDQVQNQAEVFTAMENNLDALGFATIQSQSLLDYLVQAGYQGPSQFQHIPNNNPVPQGIPSFQVQGSAYQLNLASQYNGSYAFYYTDYIRDYGLNLQSTDQVALFVAQGNGTLDILKVGYRTPNPPMIWFQIENITRGGGYRGSYQLRVLARPMATTFQYTNQRRSP